MELTVCVVKQNGMNTQCLEAFAGLLDHVDVADHTPGRVCMNATFGRGCDGDFIPGVTKTRFMRALQSMCIFRDWDHTTPWDATRDFFHDVSGSLVRTRSHVQTNETKHESHDEIASVYHDNGDWSIKACVRAEREVAVERGMTTPLRVVIAHTRAFYYGAWRYTFSIQHAPGGSECVVYNIVVGCDDLLQYMQTHTKEHACQSMSLKIANFHIA